MTNALRIGHNQPEGPAIASRITRYWKNSAASACTKAEDTRRGRVVALKFLSEELPRETRSPRPVAVCEARAASVLNHPNSCTVDDVGEHDGMPFIAMELLEGQTLAERIGARPMATEDLRDLAIQIADGLETAQVKGVVHRDIKPSNIFVTPRGQAKTLDFGVAKLARGQTRAASEPHGRTETETLPTSPAATIGTLAYMSPEQARGAELKARADLSVSALCLTKWPPAAEPSRADRRPWPIAGSCSNPRRQGGGGAGQPRSARKGSWRQRVWPDCPQGNGGG